MVSKKPLCNKHINPLYTDEPHADHPCIEGEEMMGNLTRNSQHSLMPHVVVGGAKIYRLTLPLCESLFMTEWDFEVAGDTVMPAFDHLFPARRKIKEIEDGKGTIWEYMTPAKFQKEYGVEIL